VQTLSHSYCSLVHEVVGLAGKGVGTFRLSPHSCDMVAVAETFSALLRGELDDKEAMARLDALELDAPFANGFVHGTAGAAYTPTKPMRR
jgi:collagenase-like PrtC family protease